MNMQMIGGLMVQLAADVGMLKKDMDEAEKVVNSSTQAMSKALDYAKTAFIAFAGVASINAFTGMVTGVVDATAKLHDLEMVTGMSVAALGAFKGLGAYTQTSLDTITGASLRLSKGLASASEESKGVGNALKALGISVDDFKKMSPEEQMLAVAKSMDQFKNGTEKSAVAMALFGKSGAGLLPFLKDLADDAANVEKKLTEQEKAIRANQAAMADAYGDNLTAIRKNSDGWKKDLSMGLLPVMYETSEVLKKMMGGTGGLKDEISKLAKDGTFSEWGRNLLTILSYLVDGFQLTYRVVETVVKGITGYVAAVATSVGAMGNALSAFVSGDFSGAAQALKVGVVATREVMVAAGQDIASTWDTATLGSKFRDRMADIKGMQAASADAKKDLDYSAVLDKDSDSSKKLAAEEAKRVAEYMKTVEAIVKQTAEMDLQSQSGVKLTNVQKLALDTMLKIQNGTLKLTEVEKQNVVTKLEAAFASEKLQTEMAAEKKQLEEGSKENQKYYDGLEKTTEGLQAEIKKQRESNEMIGKTAAQIGQIEIARLNEMAVAKDRLAVWAEESMLGDSVVQSYKDQAEGLRTLAQLKGNKVHLEAAKEANEAWKKTSEEIGKSFTDSLFRAFESGKNFGDAFMDGIKNLFKTTVLKLLIQPVQNGLDSLIGSALGLSSSTSSAVSGVSSASSLINGGGSSVSAVASGLGGSMSLSNTAGSIASNAGLGGGGIDGLLATNGAYGTASGTVASAVPSAGVAEASTASQALSALATVAPFAIVAAGVLTSILTPSKTLTPEEVEQVGIQRQQMADQYAAYTDSGVNRFATGGDHPGGWRIVGEDGPELEATGPSRIFNADQTTSILRGGSNDPRLAQAHLDATVQGNQMVTTAVEKLSDKMNALVTTMTRMGNVLDSAQTGALYTNGAQA